MIAMLGLICSTFQRRNVWEYAYNVLKIEHKLNEHFLFAIIPKKMAFLIGKTLQVIRPQLDIL